MEDFLGFFCFVFLLQLQYSNVIFRAVEAYFQLQLDEDFCLATLFLEIVVIYAHEKSCRLCSHICIVFGTINDTSSVSILIFL